MSASQTIQHQAAFSYLLATEYYVKCIRVRSQPVSDTLFESLLVRVSAQRKTEKHSSRLKVFGQSFNHSFHQRLTGHASVAPDRFGFERRNVWWMGHNATEGAPGDAFVEIATDDLDILKSVT